MPGYCTVLFCSKKYDHSELVSFHKFPLNDEELLEKWIKFTGRTNWKPAKSSKICSRHFENCHFREAEQRRNLLAGACPTLPNNNTDQHDFDSGAKETLGQSDRQTTAGCCRLCGCNTNEPYVDLNYSVLEFCFPAISFSNDEKLPNKLCTPCNHKLKEFSEFIRKVVEVENQLTENIAVQSQPKEAAPATVPLMTETDKLPENPKIVKIKQEPLMTIKEEKIDNQWKNTNIISNSLFPYSDSSWHPTLFTNFVTATSTTTSLINPMETTSTSYRKNDSKNFCEILEIVNLSRPLIDITDPNITRILHSQDLNFAPLSNMNIISLKPLKVEHPEEEEYDENLEHLVFQTLEEHSYARRYEKERPEDFKTETPSFENDEEVAENDDEMAEVEFVENFESKIVEIDEINTRVRRPRKVRLPQKRKFRALKRVYKRCEQCKQIFLSGWSLKNHKKNLCGNLMIFREMRRIAQEKKLLLAEPVETVDACMTKPEISIEVTSSKSVMIKAEPNGSATKSVIESDCVVDHAERQQFMCSLCGKNLSSKYSLKNHEAIHKDNKQHSCKICNKLFATQSNLLQHGLTHSTEQKHHCKQCHKAFKHRSGLNQHINGFHLKLRPHICSVCKRSFAMKYDKNQCKHSKLK